MLSDNIVSIINDPIFGEALCKIYFTNLLICMNCRTKVTDIKFNGGIFNFDINNPNKFPDICEVFPMIYFQQSFKSEKKLEELLYPIIYCCKKCFEYGEGYKIRDTYNCQDNINDDLRCAICDNSIDAIVYDGGEHYITRSNERFPYFEGIRFPMSYSQVVQIGEKKYSRLFYICSEACFNNDVDDISQSMSNLNVKKRRLNQMAID